MFFYFTLDKHHFPVSLNMARLFMIGILHVTQSALNHLQSFHLFSGSNWPGNKKTYDNFSS
jgi:hypothetical protein